MKKLLLVLFFSIASKTYATTIDEFCSSFDFQSEVEQCYRQAAEGYLDPNALNICYKLDFKSSKMPCLEVVLNRTFTPGILKMCGSKSFDSGKTQCLKEFGTQIDNENNRRLDAIKKLSTIGLEALRQNDLRTVENALKQIYQTSVH